MTVNSAIQQKKTEVSHLHVIVTVTLLLAAYPNPFHRCIWQPFFTYHGSSRRFLVLFEKMFISASFCLEVLSKRSQNFDPALCI